MASSVAGELSWLSRAELNYGQFHARALPVDSGELRLVGPARKIHQSSSRFDKASFTSESEIFYVNM